MSLSAKEAAEAVGLTKQAIIKAIHRGDLSATKTDNGEWRIEPVELFRVYQPIANQLTPVPPPIDPTAATELAVLRERLAAKDELLAAKEELIDELRHRVNLLTTTQPAAAPRVSLWRWLFPRRSQD